MGVNTRNRQDINYLNYIRRVVNDGGSFEQVPLVQYKEQYDKIMMYNPVLHLFPTSQKNNNLYTITPDNLTGFTTTRSTTGNYFNKNGVMITAPNNTPRLSYVGSTNIFQGVLIEPVSTNRVLNNLSYSSAWNTSVIHQITNDLFLLNSGKNLKVNINDSINSNSNSMCISQSITIFSGANTLSFYIKKTSDHGSIGLWGFSAISGSSYSVGFDVNTLTVFRPVTSDRFTNRVAGITPLGNNIFYCYETFTSSFSGTTSLGFSPTSSGSQSMVAGQEISISGIQLEGSNPTSFISTSGSSVTRSGDNIFSPILNYNSNQWSSFFEIEYLYDFRGQNADVSASPLIWYFRRFNASGVNFWNQNAQQNLGSLSFSNNSQKRFRCIISFNGSTISTFVNGTKVGNQITPTNPTPFQNFLNTNTYRIVSAKANLDNSVDSPHIVKGIAVYNYQLDDEQSINLTRF
jgi:hypothetical protein